MKNKINYIFWPFLLSFYFITRIINLKIIPIFTDEAIYSYWAQVALHDPAHRFLSLEDGKQPLFIWFAALSQKFIADPLIATRLVSVIAGFCALIGIYLLAKELFNRQIGLLSSILYIILPFTLLYDRMALFDSLLTMLGIYAVFFSVKMIKNPKLDLAILNGFAIGLAMITKSSGVIFLYLLPASLILFKYRNKIIKHKIVRWIGLSLVTIFIAQIIYNLLRLSPLFYIINQKNLSFVRTFQEVLSDPFVFLYSNLTSIIKWIIDYISLPLFILFIIAIILGIIKRKTSTYYLIILFFAPLLAETLFNKVLYPRFILFYFPFMIILISFGFISLLEIFTKYRKYLIIVFILFIISPAITSYRLLTNPPIANIAENDSDQYFNAWPAGYGIFEIVNFVKEESKFNKVIVGTEGTFGLFPFALKIYFRSNPNVNIIGFWPVNENNLPPQIIDASRETKTLFVFNENQADITNPRLILIKKYQKGIGNSYMRLFEVFPNR